MSGLPAKKINKNIKSFSVTILHVQRLKCCVCHVIQVIRQKLKDMRNSLILLCLCYTLTMSGATYYVSPSGNDVSGNGTINSPWFTLNKAWSYVSAGDMIYMRGGTYNYTGTNKLSNRSGTSGNLISILAYPGESPIMSYADITNPTNQYTGIYLYNSNYIYIKGIRITSIMQPTYPTAIAQYGFVPENASNCKFELIETDHIGGWGIMVANGCSNDYFLNCDSHHNADPNSDPNVIGAPYGGSDGLESASTESTTNITVDGCRFWGNSDDGVDLRRARGVWYIKNCWSFHNGYREDQITPGGNGEGFKCGGPDPPATTNILRTLTNCLSFNNLSAGISPEPDSPDNYFGMACYNCTAYNNDTGLGFNYANVNIVRNVVSYHSATTEMWTNWGENTTHSNNLLSGNAYTDISLTLTDADFLSVNSNGTDGARQSNGGLPVLSFLKPSANSQLRGAGAVISGLTTDAAGNAWQNPPSLGAYEYASGGNSAPTSLITSPANNSSFASPANITITANAFDMDGSVSMVEFYSGNTKLGSNTAAPYSFTWNNVAAGNYSLTVIATDNLNAKTTSSVISITVVNNIHATNQHPIVKISNPRKGNIYENLSTIEIDATASDPDGTISKVEFYNGETELVELTSAPYTYIWKDVAAGSYSITAIATDNVGDTTKSSPVEFEVGYTVQYDAKSDIINLYPNPNNGHFSIEFINPLQSEKGEIVITNLAGEQIYNGPVLKEEVLKQFDLSANRSGMYVLMIKDKEILVTKKFIKN